MPVSPIPKGHHNVTPYLIVDDTRAAIKFYKKAFDANELICIDDGKRVAHAEVRIGDSNVMLCDEAPARNIRSPRSIGGSPSSLMVYVTDADKTFTQAVNAGARSEEPVRDQVYGDRAGTLLDPYGHRWTVATHKEDLAPEELKLRLQTQH